MDIESFKNMILESENLTGDMEDAQAKRLINWGIEQLPQMMFGGDPENTVSSLMRIMRTINRIIGRLPEVDIDSLKTLMSHHSQAFGMPQAVSEEEYQIAKDTVAHLSADDALTYLLNWLIL